MTSPEGCIKQIIRRVGDDPERDGLKDTPDRIVRSWSELYKGYHIDPVKQMAFFDVDFAVGDDRHIADIEIPCNFDVTTSDIVVRYSS